MDLILLALIFGGGLIWAVYAGATWLERRMSPTTATQPASRPAQGPLSTIGKRLFVVFALIVIFVVIRIFSLSSQPAPSDTAAESADSPPRQVAADPTPAPTESPTAVPEPTAVPTPQPTLSPLEALEARVEAVDEFSDSDVAHISVTDLGDGNVFVEFPLGASSFFSGVTQTRMWLRSGEVIRTVYESPYPVTYLTIEATENLVDQHGNEYRDAVMSLGIPRALYDQINWEAYEDLNYKQLPDVGEDVYIHPELQE